MPTDNDVTTTAARLAAVPFRLFGRRAVVPPRRTLILQPGDAQRVLLTTPLLAALSEAYPTARFDWAVGAAAREAVATHPLVAELLDSGNVGRPEGAWRDVRDLAAELGEMGYDSCLVPNESSVLAWVAWRAGIPQRIGLSAGGRGFAHTTAVATTEPHWGAQALALARALGALSTPAPAFYPTDRQRAAMTQQVAAWGWTGERPLLLFHVDADAEVGWPAERYALALNRISRDHDVQLAVLGPLAGAVSGLAAAPIVRAESSLSLGEVGALAEPATLLVSGSALVAQVAATAGCPVVVLGGGEVERRPLPAGAPLVVVESNADVDDLAAAVSAMLSQLRGA